MDNLITIEMIDDWAGAAMQGLMTAQGQSKDIDVDKIASVAYNVAIAMANARGAFLEEHGDDLAESEQGQ